MPAHDLLVAITDLAGEVPFLALDPAGRILHASPGAHELTGCRFDLDGTPVRMGEGRIEGSLAGDWLRQGLRQRLLHVEDPRGERRVYRLHARAVPAGDPEVLLLRFDFEAGGQATAGGLPLTAVDAHPDAVEFFGLWTRSARMKELFSILGRVAATDATVLIRGASGSGKEHVARALHSLSPRAERSFVAFNCAALTPSLLESQLFGHVKGAFTGAAKDHPGLFVQAEGGTIFLDEVAELAPEAQAKLLRVLQEREVVPVGGVKPRKVDVRVLSATHRSLRGEVAAGRFREDLMYRLRVVPVFTPPLAERSGDVELLLSLFLQQQVEQGRRRIVRVEPAAVQALLDHAWPGNVRELQNVVEYATIVGTGAVLRHHHLPPELREPDEARAPHLSAAVAQPVVEDERASIEDALRRAGGNRSEAARLLGLHRTTLWRRMRRLGIEDRTHSPA